MGIATGENASAALCLTFWNDNVATWADFSDSPLWVAHYTSKPAPNVPTGFPDFSFWQYSETGDMSGIVGNKVDQDRFKGSMEELRILAGY